MRDARKIRGTVEGGFSGGELRVHRRIAVRRVPGMLDEERPESAATENRKAKNKFADWTARQGRRQQRHAHAETPGRNNPKGNARSRNRSRARGNSLRERTRRKS